MNKKRIAHTAAMLAAVLLIAAAGLLAYKFNQKINVLGAQLDGISARLSQAEDSAAGADYYNIGFDNQEAARITVHSGQEKGTYRFWQLPLQTGNQGASYVIELPGGELIVIDGGFKGDGDYLHDFLMERGGVVKGWFLTHPHVDHIGAFLYNVNKEGHNGLTIQNVYYSPFTPEYFTEEAEGKDLKALNEYLLFDEFEAARNSIADIPFIPMLADDRLEIGGITVDCLHSFDGTIYHVNSNSLVLNFDFGGYRIMITGDITDGSLSKMLERIPQGDDRWKTDCVQIPHHGFGGFTDQLLRLTQPGLAFIDCTLPQYYDRDEEGNLGDGRFGTQETAAILKNRNLPSLKAFNGPNEIVID
ncbi:ComEC/Rec2 family competence protein [Lachnotalea sp. AF33-28]|uniref:ComEC/Rec2 family competence protein n=1 Tax=Lachnotalea sp. AF33-28 TaxID=2292046 RepID=UPI000E4F7CDE|nr:MBL fold metallo-hydrolase [Lachnotalea sp. AF33-28]RHP34932.1 MBL fold metallo-hydrolase [Lachnotalea sp. AF33-28]